MKLRRAIVAAKDTNNNDKFLHIPIVSSSSSLLSIMITPARPNNPTSINAIEIRALAIILFIAASPANIAVNNPIPNNISFRLEVSTSLTLSNIATHTCFKNLEPDSITLGITPPNASKHDTKKSPKAPMIFPVYLPNSTIVL